MDIQPPSESDGESSDGDYFPNAEDEEDDEYWDDNAEEFDVDETDLEVDLDDDWDEPLSVPSDIGTNDQYWDEGDTTLDSEADMSIGGEIVALAEDGWLLILLVQKFDFTLQQIVDRFWKEKTRRCRMKLYRILSSVLCNLQQFIILYLKYFRVMY